MIYASFSYQRLLLSFVAFLGVFIVLRRIIKAKCNHSSSGRSSSKNNIEKSSYDKERISFARSRDNSIDMRSSHVINQQSNSKPLLANEHFKNQNILEQNVDKDIKKSSVSSTNSLKSSFRDLREPKVNDKGKKESEKMNITNDNILVTNQIKKDDPQILVPLKDSENIENSKPQLGKGNILVFEIDKEKLKFSETDKIIIIHPLKRIIRTYLECCTYFLSLILVDIKAAELEFEKDWRTHLNNSRSQELLESINGKMVLNDHVTNKNHDHDLCFDAIDVNMILSFQVILPSGAKCRLKVFCENITGKLNLNLNLSTPFSATLYWDDVNIEKITHHASYDNIDNGDDGTSKKTLNSDMIYIENFMEKTRQMFKRIKGEYLLDDFYKITQINTLSNPTIIKQMFQLKKSKYALITTLKSIIINSKDLSSMKNHKKIRLIIKSGNLEFMTKDYELRHHINVLKEFAIPFDDKGTIKFEVFVDQKLKASTELFQSRFERIIGKINNFTTPLDSIGGSISDSSLSISVEFEVKYTLSRNILDSQYDRLSTLDLGRVIPENKYVSSNEAAAVINTSHISMISNKPKVAKDIDIYSSQSDFNGMKKIHKKKSFRSSFLKAIGLKKKTKKTDTSDRITVHSDFLPKDILIKTESDSSKKKKSHKSIFRTTKKKSTTNLYRKTE